MITLQMCIRDRIVTLPQETFPSESPLHFADHRDESVIVGYYTSAEDVYKRQTLYISPLAAVAIPVNSTSHFPLDSPYFISSVPLVLRVEIA